MQHISPRYTLKTKSTNYNWMSSLFLLSVCLSLHFLSIFVSVSILLIVYITLRLNSKSSDYQLLVTQKRLHIPHPCHSHYPTLTPFCAKASQKILYLFITPFQFTLWGHQRFAKEEEDKNQLTNMTISFFAQQ